MCSFNNLFSPTARRFRRTVRWPCATALLYYPGEDKRRKAKPMAYKTSGSPRSPTATKGKLKGSHRFSRQRKKSVSSVKSRPQQTARKKRKFRALDEFRYCFSYKAGKHPHYVFGEYGDEYASFGLTSTPKKEYKSSKLTKNPQSGKADPSHIQHKYHLTKKRYYSKKPMSSWRFDVADLPLIRHLKKKARRDIRKK